MKPFYFLLLTVFLLSITAHSQTINTFAGNGIAGYGGDGGAATSASLARPISCTMDGAGNLYISEFNNSVIRKVSSSGIITTFAGTGLAGFSGDGGPATAAQINNPEKVAIDGAGNVYICDFSNNRIRKVNTAGIITTIAGTGVAGDTGDGGPAIDATFWLPAGIAIDPAGNIYICDEWNNRIRKINTAGIITNIAGNGPTGFLAGGFGGDGGAATVAQINFPVGIALTPAGDIIFADDGNHRIRKISAAGIITTIAGNGTAAYSGDGGPATAAEIYSPEGIALDPAGNLYICETGDDRVRKIDASGIITTFAGIGSPGYSGDGGPATSAALYDPEGVFVDTATSCVYVCDASNSRVRRVGSCSSTISPYVCNTLILPDSLHHFCNNNNDTLYASVTGPDSVLSISWTPSAGLFDTTALTPVLSAGATPGWRYVTVSSLIPDNLVINGDFSAGNTGFASPDYTYLSATPYSNEYTITTDEFLGDPGIGVHFYDHTNPPSGNMLFANGGSPAANTVAWQETVAITGGDQYEFTAWYAYWTYDVAGTSNPNLIVKIIPVGAGSPSADTFTVLTSEDSWHKQMYTWYAPVGATSAIIQIVDQNAAYYYNDFCLDDISFQPICTIKDSIYVVVAIADTTYSHEDTSICAGNNILISAPTGYTSYLWNNGSTSPTINVSSSGSYWVYSDEADCHMLIDTVNVIIKPSPFIATGSDTVICQGGQIIIGQSSQAGVNYLWNTGGEDASIVVSDSGTYILTANENGCIDTTAFHVNLLSAPILNFGPDTVVCGGASGFVLSAASNNGSYTWSDGSNGQNYTVQNSGTYWATVTNMCGTASDTITVTFEQCNIWFPSAFTPNNDGLNDYARAGGSLGYYTDFSLHIFNRFGQVVFSTQDIYQGWDGSFNNTRQDVGTYFYLMTYMLDGKKGMMKGDLQLIR